MSNFLGSLHPKVWRFFRKPERLGFGICSHRAVTLLKFVIEIYYFRELKRGIIGDTS